MVGHQALLPLLAHDVISAEVMWRFEKHAEDVVTAHGQTGHF